MKHYAYTFSEAPESEEKHLECIDHACAMASLYNEVSIIFKDKGILNFNCQDKRVKTYETLELFGIKEVHIERESVQQLNIKIDEKYQHMLLSKEKCNKILSNADVKF